MDIMLKGEMDGIEAAREIKNRLRIPVLYLTAYTDDETLERAKTTEPAGYISKPFKEEDLHSNIEMALHKHRAEKKEAEKEAEKESEKATE
jgi:CheY-like chemotaxis protein